ncbi:MAG TPA: L,D-transpeptidase family protein [Motilibacteraceae bacterium]|nr:L,D-transpeptidase family protein [Motilibacteraceae bacterium]
MAAGRGVPARAGCALVLSAALLAPATPATPAASGVRPAAATSAGVDPAVYAYPRPRLAVGASGPHVTELQWRLWYLRSTTGFGSASWVTGRYGTLTRTAVRRFQQSAHLPVTGVVDARTSYVLRRRSDPVMYRACLASARAWCLSKADLTIRYVEDGRVSVARWRPGLPTLPAASPTREGRFSVFARSTRRWSSQFRVWMPWWLQFSGGEGIHYSPDFARYCYGTAAHPRGSHGCANVRDQAWLRARWARTPLGTPVVVVYWTG